MKYSMKLAGILNETGPTLNETGPTLNENAFHSFVVANQIFLWQLPQLHRCNWQLPVFRRMLPIVRVRLLWVLSNETGNAKFLHCRKESRQNTTAWIVCRAKIGWSDGKCMIVSSSLK